MKRLTLIIFLGILIMASCNTDTIEQKDSQANNAIAIIDTTPRVTGIGGIFFLSENPQETNA